MKNCYKQLAYCLCIVFCVFTQLSCEKEEKHIETNSEIHQLDHNHDSTVEKLTIDQIPELNLFITEKITSKIKSNYSGSYAVTPFGNISLKEITKVTDLTGNANYTFAIIPKTYQPRKYYNLIVEKSNDSSKPDSYILEYELDEEFYLQYITGEKWISDFKGTVRKYQTDEFLNNISKNNSKSRCEEQNPDPTIPNSCLEEVINPYDDTTNPYNDDAGNSGSSGGNNSTSGPGNTGTTDGDGTATTAGTGGGLIEVSIIPCTCAGHIEVEDCTCDVQPVIVIIIRSQTKSAFGGSKSGCDQNNFGEIAVVFEDMLSNLNLDFTEILWMNENCQEYNLFYEFWKEEAFDPKMKPFLEKSIKMMIASPNTNKDLLLAVDMMNAIHADKLTTAEASVLFDLLNQNSYSDEALKASALTVKIKNRELLNGPYDDTYYDIFNQYFDVDTHNPLFAARLDAQIAVVKWQHRDDEWSDTQIYATALWQLLSDPVHLLLDVGGLIPVVGEVADLVNGGIYLLEGDQINAGLSFAGAVPFAGWAATGTKFVGKVVVLAGGAKAIRVIAKNTDHIASIANKLKSKFDLVTFRGVTLLKDKLGNIIARDKEDVARVLGNLADAVNDRQKNVINQWKDNIGSQSNKRKGNFGEMASDLDLAEKGYIPLHTRIDNIDAPGHNGIDAVMEKNGQYFIVESKFSSTMTPSLNPATSTLPKQMSDAWIQRPGELANAVGNADLADDIIDAGYTRVLATHGPDGNKIYKLVDANGNIGNVWTP